MTRIKREGTRWIAVAAAAAALLALLALVAVVARPGDAPASATAVKKQARCALGDRPAAQLSARELRKAVTCLINRQRNRRDNGRLSRNRKLQRAAQKHTKVIVKTNCFAHRCPGEPGLEERLRRVGYLKHAHKWGYAESTGCAESPKAMVRNWLDVRFHRRNLVGRRYRHVGIGAAQGGPKRRCKDGFATFTAVFGWRTR